MEISQIQIITMAKRIILSNHFTVVIVVVTVVRASIKIDDNREPIHGNQKKENEKKAETKTNTMVECRTLPIWKQIFFETKGDSQWMWRIVL